MVEEIIQAEGTISEQEIIIIILVEEILTTTKIQITLEIEVITMCVMKTEAMLLNPQEIILSQLAVIMLGQQEHIRQHHPEVQITRTHHLVLILLLQVVLVEAEVAEVTVAADVHQVVVVEGGNLFSNFFSFIV